MRLILALFVAMSAACGPRARDLDYLAELERCRERSQTCEQYAACRARVAADAGRPFVGVCAIDAGAP